MNSSSARNRLFMATVLAVAGCSSGNDALTPTGSKSPTSKQQDDVNNTDPQLDQTKAPATVGSPVVYTVPSTGGSVTVTGMSGVKVDFQVPASASGKKITFTPTTAAEIGWNDPNFAEVIRMEPDGSKFADPIVVRLSSKALVVLDFPSSPSKSVPEGLQLNSTKDGFLLYHFSTLVVFSPDYDCESQEGWIAADESETAANCTDPEFPVMFKLNCLTHPYCLRIDAQCCAAKDGTGCDIASPTLSLSYSRADETGEEYAYCIAKEEELNRTSTSVCTQYSTAACDCSDGTSGQKTCLKDETGWTDCVCEAPVQEPDSNAVCPQFHEGDCSVADANNCGCSTTDDDGAHTYAIVCNADSGCSCTMDDAEIASFAWEAQACETPEQVRERWFVHCSQAACP